MRSKERVGRLEIGGVVRGWWWFVLLCCVQALGLGSKIKHAVCARAVGVCINAALLAQAFTSHPPFCHFLSYQIKRNTMTQVGPDVLASICQAIPRSLPASQNPNMSDRKPQRRGLDMYGRSDISDKGNPSRRGFCLGSRSGVHADIGILFPLVKMTRTRAGTFEGRI